MTIAERRRQQFFRSKLVPISHGYCEKVWSDTASYEGYVYTCECGEHFVDKNELDKHVEEPCEKP